MAFHPLDSQNKNKPEPEQNNPGFGGYSTRYDYEQSRSKESPWVRAGRVVLVLVLVCLAMVGAVSLIHGSIVPEGNSLATDSGSIKVPTQSDLAAMEKPLDQVIAALQASLLTFEVEKTDGSYRYGTGFLVSDEGYAVCAASLFAQPETLKSTQKVTVYLEGGISTTATFRGAESALGIALLHLEHTSVPFCPITVKNSAFLERGESLVAVGAYKARLFYGAVSRGIVASIGPAVRVGEGESAVSANLFYLDLKASSTLYGAPVIDESGAVAGFCTDAIEPLYGVYTPVVPINTVYTVINDMLDRI